MEQKKTLPTLLQRAHKMVRVIYCSNDQCKNHAIKVLQALYRSYKKFITLLTPC